MAGARSCVVSLTVYDSEVDRVATAESILLDGVVQWEKTEAGVMVRKVMVKTARGGNRTRELALAA